MEERESEGDDTDIEGEFSEVESEGEEVLFLFYLFQLILNPPSSLFYLINRSRVWANMALLASQPT